MDYKFEVTIELSVESNEKPLGEKELTYDGLVKIKTFLTEFFKHPEAIRAYYSSYFLDEFINNSAAQWDVLCARLNYMPNHVPLFKEIAQSCPPEITAYITDLFSDDTDDLQENTRKEIERRILEELLSPLKVNNTKFIAK